MIWSQLTTRLQSIEPAAVVLLLGRSPLPDDQVTTAEILQIGVYDWLGVVGRLRDSQRQLAVKLVQADLGCIARRYNEVSGGLKPHAGLVLAEFRWLSVSPAATASATPYIDTNTGNVVDRLPYQPLTSVCLDLNVLLLQLTKIE